ncbi:hypothetical protein [Acinetobacter sp. TSRC1-2]|uniref:hypothetical protein n=1 Tax=unclassified Acinetobacter TaxID=196816 RepID=UPI003CF41710
MNNKRDFLEALECFKVIESCLKSIYSGETHMCRALSAQLRILLCDYSNNSKPLLMRLIPNLELLSLVNTYDDSKDLDLKLSRNVLIGMSFEARCYWNGVEDSIPLYGQKVLPLNDWADQIILSYPIPLTIRKLIKLIANKGGGAHVDEDGHPLLELLQEKVFQRLNQGELLIVGLSKIIQQLSFQLIQAYELDERNLPLKNINLMYPSILNAAKVPKECFERPFQTAQLLISYQ